MVAQADVLTIGVPKFKQDIFVVTDKQFGAKGDGVTDDCGAIQDAIDAASDANGGVVFFPAGLYLLRSQLKVKSFVTLEGVGIPFRAPEYGIDPALLGAMITGPTATTFDLIQNSDTVNGNTGITIRNLWIGVGSGTTADVTAVMFNKVRRSKIENCYLRGAVTTSRYGLRYTGISEHCTVRDCWFEGCGIVTGLSANTLRVLDTEIAQGGIAVFGGFGHIIRGCDIYQDGVGAGVAYPAYPNGILLADCTEPLVVNNQIAATREHGIYLKQAAVSGLIDGNTIVNSSQEVSGVWSGICLDSASAARATIDNVVTGNRCYNRGGVTQAYGIVVTSGSGTQTTNNEVVDNNVRGNASGGIQIGVSGLKNIIKDNQGVENPSVASAATIDVAVGAQIVTVTGTTNITSILAGYAGQRVTLVFTGILTVTDGSNLKLNGNFVTTADDSITLICDGTNWFETSRSVN